MDLMVIWCWSNGDMMVICGDLIGFHGDLMGFKWWFNGYLMVPMVNSGMIWDFASGNDSQFAIENGP